MNLFDIVLHLIKQVYKCENLFTKIKSDYLIQLRPYGTSEIKRYIYHKHGGKYVSVIQKNPEQLMRQGGMLMLISFLVLGLKLANVPFNLEEITIKLFLSDLW